MSLQIIAKRTLRGLGYKIEKSIRWKKAYPPTTTILLFFPASIGARWIAIFTSRTWWSAYAPSRGISSNAAFRSDMAPCCSPCSVTISGRRGPTTASTPSRASPIRSKGRGHPDQGQGFLGQPSRYRAEGPARRASGRRGHSQSHPPGKGLVRQDPAHRTTGASLSCISTAISTNPTSSLWKPSTTRFSPGRDHVRRI
jgi:hypothetical protein